MMKRFLTFALCALGFAANAMAQDAAAPEEPKSPWTWGGNTSLTFNQVSLKNWSAGGKNSVAGTFLFRSYANYKTENATWNNTFDAGYGMTKYSGEDLQKTEDKLLLSTTYGYNAARQKLFYSGAFDLKTQFDNGYKYGEKDTIRISSFFAPAYMTISLGMLYKPNDWFMAYLSPLTGKVTVVADTTLSTRYGLDEGAKSKMEYGAYGKVEINKKNIFTNVDYYLRATLFSNLVKDPEHIDVDAETGLNFTINQYLSALVKVNLLFDNDIKYVDADGNEHGARLQCKELVGFGLAFKW